MSRFSETGVYHIYWKKDAVWTQLSPEEMNDLVADLVDNDAKGYVDVRNGWNKEGKLVGRKTVLKVWDTRVHPVRWTIDRSSNGFSIYLLRDTGEEVIFEVYTTYDEMLEVEKGEDLGDNPYNILSRLGKEMTGASLNEAFGGVRCKPINNWKQYTPQTEEEKEAICYKRACPPRLQWFDRELAGRHIYLYNKADISSAYPSVAGRLYDHNTRLIVEGSAEEVMRAYPNYDLFIGANTSIVIERNSFDSRKIAEHPIMKKMKRQCANAADDNRWYIMQLSAFDYTPVWQEIYKRKSEGDTTAKLLMNKTIGCFESIGTSYAQHFKGFNAAVIYYRHLKKMLDYCDALEARGNRVIHLAIDSIGWIGQPEPDITSKEKKLGALITEYENADFCIKSNGVYAIQTGDTIMYKAQGTKRSDIEAAGGIHCIEDILKQRQRLVSYSVLRKNDITYFELGLIKSEW